MGGGGGVGQKLVYYVPIGRVGRLSSSDTRRMRIRIMCREMDVNKTRWVDVVHVHGSERDGGESEQSCVWNKREIWRKNQAVGTKRSVAAKDQKHVTVQLSCERKCPTDHKLLTYICMFCHFFPQRLQKRTTVPKCVEEG